MQRDAHQRAPHGPPLLDQFGQLVVPESFNTRPQTDVGRRGHLRLHADEVLDGVGGGFAPPAEQQLPLEQRPVESAKRQQIGAYFTRSRMITGICLDVAFS
jgi:hypothetical protein